MPIDEAFVSAARKAFNPYGTNSGTEHMAPFLYSLVRMVRPMRVVEFGSGYTTLFVLRALADNKKEIEEERRALKEKTATLGDLPPSIGDLIRKRSPNFDLLPKPKANGMIQQVYYKWLNEGEKAANADPGYYLTPYEPHLYSFEKLEEGHAYVTSMRRVVEEIGHGDLFSHIHTEDFATASIPAPIDLAWNDDYKYRDFFRAFWPKLNDKGGLFVFHNVPAAENLWDDVQWMKRQRKKAGDLELLTLQEPHKVHQNGCVILRRTSRYEPTFAYNDVDAVYRSLLRFMGKEVGPAPAKPKASLYRKVRYLVKKKLKELG
ncbi:MAG: class I SAM-dependent methyltransferase [Byssovorax sp.]